jgi:predicted nucleic acid-binding protein
LNPCLRYLGLNIVGEDLQYVMELALSLCHRGIILVVQVEVRILLGVQNVVIDEEERVLYSEIAARLANAGLGGFWVGF